MKKRFSQAYIEHRKRGPFSSEIDPWAETGRYFQQIHAGMIGQLLTQIQDPLLALGYEAGRETSLQILERREPDIYVRKEEFSPSPPIDWNYPAAAQAVLAEPGIAIEWNIPDLHAIYIRDIESNDLVTIVEVVSPSNKIEQQEIADYRERRERMIRKGINVMEIDPTRSVKRLLQDVTVATYAYHTAVYLPGQIPRVIGTDFGTPLKRVALPLRGEVVPMELQAAYDFAYQQASIAGQIYSDTHYTLAELPFPSLLNEKQRITTKEKADAWAVQLETLKAENT